MKADEIGVNSWEAIQVARRATAEKLKREIENRGGTVVNVERVPHGLKIYFRGDITYYDAAELKRKYNRK